jgi:hypothetical protein
MYSLIYFFTIFFSDTIHQENDKLILVHRQLPLMDSKILVYVPLVFQYFLLEYTATFESIAIPHKMVMTMDINYNVIDLVLSSWVGVFWYKYIAHQIAEVMLFQSRYACHYELIMNNLMGLGDVAGQLLRL